MHPFLIYVQIKFFWIPEPINGRVHRGFNLQVDVYDIHFCCYSDTNNLSSYIFIHKYPAHFSSMGSRLVIETCSLKLNCRKGKWNRRRYFFIQFKNPQPGGKVLYSSGTKLNAKRSSFTTFSHISWALHWLGADCCKTGHFVTSI